MNIERELREALDKCHQDYALQMYEIAVMEETINLQHTAMVTAEKRGAEKAQQEIAELKETITNLKYVQDEKRIGADAIRDMLDEFKSEILDYEDWVVEYFADYADNLDSDE